MLDILPSFSHTDHGLDVHHLSWLKRTFAYRTNFFIATMDIPISLEPVPLGLYGPVVGDEPVEEESVHYVIRPGRSWASRCVRRPFRTTRQLTVIAGPHEDKSCVLYTAYGGPLAPKEPGDTTLDTWEKVCESRSFWKVHALAVG